MASQQGESVFFRAVVPARWTPLFFWTTQIGFGGLLKQSGHVIGRKMVCVGEYVKRQEDRVNDQNTS